MNSSLKSIELLALCISLIILASCTIETAKEPSDKHLYIASDYLEVKDSVLFQEFEKEMDVAVHIIPIQPDELIFSLQKDGLNSDFDIIMVKSLYHLYKLYKKELLHPIYLEDVLDEQTCSYSSWKFRFVALGIDPYILAWNPNYVTQTKTYEDLTRSEYFTDFQPSEKVPFLSSVLIKKNRVKGNNWIKMFSSNAADIALSSDSLIEHGIILTTYSDFNTNSPVAKHFKGKSCFFPNSNGMGTLFNVRSISLVNQAQNYVNGRKFISFYTDSIRNIELNKNLKTMSVFGNDYNCIYHSDPPNKLVSYYSMVERVLNKVKIR